MLKFAKNLPDLPKISQMRRYFWDARVYAKQKINFSWPKHFEKIRSSQDFILANSCAELFFPVSIVKGTHSEKSRQTKLQHLQKVRIQAFG